MNRKPIAGFKPRTGDDLLPEICWSPKVPRFEKKSNETTLVPCRWAKQGWKYKDNTKVENNTFFKNPNRLNGNSSPPPPKK